MMMFRNCIDPHSNTVKIRFITFILELPVQPLVSESFHGIDSVLQLC